LPGKVHTEKPEPGMSFTREDDLRSSFVRDALPEVWWRPVDGLDVCTVWESTCSNGRADWVWAAVSRDWQQSIEPSVAGLLQQPTCSRMLGALKAQAARTRGFLHARCGVSERTFRGLLHELLAAELVAEVGAGRYVLGPRFAEPQMEICSFEFKLYNWRRAFQQAKRYRTFSHRVYVVMPAATIRRVAGHMETFARFNVGIISHDQDGTTRRLLLSRKTQPASRAGFIRAMGMFCDQAKGMPTLR